MVEIAFIVENLKTGAPIYITCGERIKLKLVKGLVEAESGIAAKDQHLYFASNKKELADETLTIAEYGITEGCKLVLAYSMSVHVVNETTKQKYTVSVLPFETINTLQIKVFQLSGWEVSKQTLKFNGTELFKTITTLHDNKIENGDTVTVFLREDNLNLYIETADGKKHEIKVSPTDDVHTLKQTIQSISGINVNDQLLKHQGKELNQPSQIIGQIGIKDGDTLTVHSKAPKPITVNVKTPDGKTHKINILPSDTLQSIKKNIHDVSAMDIQDHLFKYNDKVLNNPTDTAKDIGITDGGTITVQTKSTEMKVDVETPDGKTHKINVLPSDTVVAIKQKIKEKTGMDMQHQILKYNGKELDGFTDTAKDIGIKDGGTIKVEKKHIQPKGNNDDEEKRKKEEALQKWKEKREMFNKLMAKMEAGGVLTDQEKRLLREYLDTRKAIAYFWWSRLGQPKKLNFISLCETHPELIFTNVTKEDIESLPWLNAFMLDVPKMNHWMGTLDPEIVTIVDRGL